MRTQMDKKLKNEIIKNALEKGKVRTKLKLWKYLPIIESIYESWGENIIKRDTLIMSLLEEIADDALHHK